MSPIAGNHVIGTCSSEAKAKLLRELGCDRIFYLFYTDKLKIAVDPTQFQGIQSIPNAVEYLLSGQNCGKVVVRF